MNCIDKIEKGRINIGVKYVEILYLTGMFLYYLINYIFPRYLLMICNEPRVDDCRKGTTAVNKFGCNCKCKLHMT